MAKLLSPALESGTINGGIKLQAADDPSAEALETMLEELVEQYRGAAFQEEMAAAQAACIKAGNNWMLEWGRVVLKVQAPILQKHGLPPTAQGVDLMKHAVQRRICEGSVRLEELANAARRLLGIQPLPDRTASAEQALSKLVDETAQRLGLAADGQLEQQCQKSIGAALSQGKVSSQVANYLEKLLENGAPLLSVRSLLSMATMGVSLQQLKGSAEVGEVPVLNASAPLDITLFKECIFQNKPCILKSAFQADEFPPMCKFPDFDFLRRTCGHRRVVAKPLAHNDSQGRPVFVSDPELKLPLTAFLDQVEAHEKAISSGRGPGVPYYLGKVPLSGSLPELAREIEEASTCPRRRFGEYFGDLTKEGVFTYFGCGRNTTAVHFDAQDNLMLCLCGTKKIWLYPPNDALHLYPVLVSSGGPSGASRSAVVPFASFDNLPPELQVKYPLLAKAQPVEIHVAAGDLLYLPSCWWHCVEGSEDRNMILNWWFNWHPEKLAFSRAQ